MVYFTWTTISFARFSSAHTCSSMSAGRSVWTIPILLWMWLVVTTQKTCQSKGQGVPSKISSKSGIEEMIAWGFSSQRRNWEYAYIVMHKIDKAASSNLLNQNRKYKFQDMGAWKAQLSRRQTAGNSKWATKTYQGSLQRLYCIVTSRTNLCCRSAF